MKKTEAKGYSFLSKDFYALLEKQKYTCKYSGRELQPRNTIACHIYPLSLGLSKSKHELKNIVLIDKDVSYIKKYVTPNDLLKLCMDVVEHHGYTVTKKKSGLSA